MAINQNIMGVNPNAFSSFAQPRPVAKPAANKAPTINNGFTPETAPSAVFSGQAPAVDYKPNPYAINQLSQFNQMDQVDPSTQNAFAARMQSMGGSAQPLFNAVQDASIGPGLLGGELKMNTVLPAYNGGQDVGYQDMYGNGGTAVGVGKQPVDPNSWYKYANFDPTKLMGSNAAMLKQLYGAQGTNIKKELKTAQAEMKKYAGTPDLDQWNKYVSRINDLNSWNKQYKNDLKGALTRTKNPSKTYA